MFYYYFEINNYFFIFCVSNYVTGSSTQVQYQIDRINVQSYL